MDKGTNRMSDGIAVTAWIYTYVGILLSGYRISNFAHFSLTIIDYVPIA